MSQVSRLPGSEPARVLASLGMHTRVLESMTEGVSVTDEQGFIIYTNPAEDRMFGYEPGELLGQNVTVQNAYPPDENSRLVADVIAHLKETGSWRGEWLNRRKDGSTFHTYARITSLEIDDHQYWVCVQEDITARREASERIAESEQKLRAFVEATSALMWNTDASGRYPGPQPSFEKFTGLEWPAYAADGGLRAVHPDDVAAVTRAWTQSVQSKQPFEIEYRLWHAASGQYRHVQAKGIPVRAQNGEVREWVGTATDIHERRTAEEERRATEEKLRSLILASPIPIVALTSDGEVTLWNPAAERVFGWTEQEVLGRPLPFIPDEKLDEHRRMRQSDLSGSGFVNREIHRRRKDGRYIDLLVSTAPIRNPQGSVAGIMSVYLDITERKRMEAVLRESEARFRALVEQSPMSTQIFSIDGYLEMGNRAWEQLWGVTIEDVRDFNAFEDPQMVASGIAAYLNKVREGHAVVVPEIPFRPDRGTRAGEEIFVRSAAYPVYDETGAVRQMVVVQEDMTDRLRAQEALRESEERFRIVTQAMPALVWTARPDGFADYSNESWLAYTGQKLEDTYGSGWLNVVHPDDHERIRQVWNRSIATGEPYQLEYRIRRAADGQWRWHLGRAQALRDREGRVAKWLGIAADVHEKVETAERLLESELRFRSLFQQSPQALLESDWSAVVRLLRESGVSNVREHLQVHPEEVVRCLRSIRITEANRAAMELFEARHKHIPVERIDWMIAPESFPAMIEALAAAAEGRSQFRAEIFISALSGTRKHVICDFGILPGHADGFDRLIVSLTDTTDRKMAEDALRRSETYFRELADKAPCMLWLTDPDGACTYLNQRWCEFTGMSRAQGLGLGWLGPVHPDDCDSVRDIFLGAHAERTRFQADYRILDASGRWRWTVNSAEPRFGAAGEFLGYIGTLVDITERKLAQEALRTSNEELQKANLELEEFAFVASHDLQEPLRTVNIYSQLLLRRFPLQTDTEVRKFADFVQSGVRRMEDLIQDLLAYSRVGHSLKSDARLGEADLNRALEQARLDLGDRIQASGAVIESDVLPVVRGDLSQLSQVFQNLLSNSIKYARDGVQPRIRITATSHGDRCVISVADNGIGFDPRFRERVFGLFKRLHRDEYPGTGLGLAICKRIVERYGGCMQADSQPGQGSVFTFELPAARSSQPADS